MGRRDEPKLRSNDLVLVGLILAVTVVVGLIVRAQSGPNASRPDAAEVERSTESVDGDRTVAPSIGGRVLPVVDELAQAPNPAQWGGSSAGVPFAQWWSSALSGPGSETLWSHPLATRIDPLGGVEIAAPIKTVAADGTSSAPFIAAVTLRGPSDDVSIEVVDSGAFDVIVDVAGRDTSRRLSLVQGSPFVEVAINGPSQWFIPGLDVVASSADLIEFETSEGPWIIAADGPIELVVDGDDLSIAVDQPRRLVVGPRLTSTDQWTEIALTLAGAALQTTVEDTIVGPDGSVTQQLIVVRDGGAESVFVLLPHQEVAIGDSPNGDVVSTGQGAIVVAGTDQLRLQYPSVPLAWDLFDATNCEGCDTVGESPGGSYFAGKEALRLAQLAQLAQASDEHDASTSYLDALAGLFIDLVSHGGQLELTWDPNWGSVVVLPGEFGLGRELNDHSLQYGYWIAAASIFEQHRSGEVPELVETIDLLIGDMGGTRLLEEAWPGLAPQRTWSPYEGHSWASGLAPFPDGNNLESISESLNAWWATARWLHVTGRAEQAGEAIARFTIESALSSHRWLPTDSAEGGRPWSGIVWAGKVDNSTWFDDRPEAALGIRLLPLTPASLARYGAQDEVEAARRRWSWCDENGGCTSMWSNLLDSDAAVAGRPALVTGAEPETSTSASISLWWRTLIETRGMPSFDWSCSAGIVAFDAENGSSVAVGSSPSGLDVTGVCRHDTTGAIASIAVLANGQTEFELPTP